MLRLLFIMLKANNKLGSYKEERGVIDLSSFTKQLGEAAPYPANTASGT